MDMTIVIPTRGRVGRQVTFGKLPPVLRRQTVIVCPQRERTSHEANHPQVREVVAQPDPGCTIAQKRKWILECGKFGDKLVMLDDDCRFCYRREDNPGLFRQPTDEEVVQAFEELAGKLSPEMPHAGFSARGGGISDKAKEGGWQEGKRMMYALGYHVPTVLANCELGRIETREDMDLTLQLLRKGFPNAVNFTFAVDQKFGNPGGCTEERTIERSNADARKLEQLHRGYVRITEQAYKQSISRLEVVCQWEKALRDGKLGKSPATAGA